MISLLVWFQAPELRFGYGPIIGLISILLLIIVNERKKLMNLFYFDKIVLILLLFFLAFSNKDNISKIYSYEKNNFEKSKFEVYLKSNDYKVYYPTHNSFCDDFD